MKSGILTIMKKELARFFGDKRTVAGVLLPGVMIYVLYSFMGTAMGSVFGVEEDYVPSIQAVRLPQSIAALADSAGMALTEGEEAGLPAAMDQVAGQELDLLAERYVLGRGGRSPRAARQFVDGLLSASRNTLSENFPGIR